MSEQRAVGVEILSVLLAEDMQQGESLGASLGFGRSSSFSDRNANSIRASIGGSIASLNPLNIGASKRGGADCPNYIFTMQVWIPAEQHNYVVTRTYKSFILLQTQLMKKYPRSNLPLLPKGSDIAPNKKTALNEYISALMTVPEVRPCIRHVRSSCHACFAPFTMLPWSSISYGDSPVVCAPAKFALLSSSRKPNPILP